MKKKSIRVEGMTCAMCAKTIKNAFEDDPHADVSVNVAAGRVIATYDETETGLTDIAERIERSGYKVIMESTLDDPKRERRKLLTFMLASVVLSFPLLWAMFGHLAWFSFLYVPDLFMDGIFQLVLAGIVQFVIGSRFYMGAYRSLKSRAPGMDVLVVLGTSSAYFYSVYILMTHTSPHHHPVLYFEISAIIITMVMIGNYFEHLVKERTTDALVELMHLGAKEARLIDAEGERIVPIEEVAVGDRLSVLANEQFPVDGVIVEGETHVDASAMTGESIPLHKTRDDSVIGATMNVGERVVIEARKVGLDTLLSKIIAHVEEASGDKLPIQRAVDRIASYFVPVVLLIALVNFLLHMFVLQGFGFTDAFTRSIAILVISCPCALGLATPTSILVGNGIAAKRHILYKGGEFFEIADKIDSMAFDKTGTLTRGEPRVTDFIGDDEVLSIAHGLERQSTHPVSSALTAYAEEQGVEPVDIGQFKVHGGKGIEGRASKRHVRIGTPTFMKENGIDTQEFEKDYHRLASRGKTVNYIALDRRVAGLYAVRDELKPTTKAVIEKLHAMGIETAMVTGDHRIVAEAIAEEAGIKRVFAAVLPHEKADIVKRLQADGKTTAYVGDGINDAPALKQADVGFAMGTGSDIAIGSGDVTLMSKDLSSAIRAIEVSTATLRNIKQNLFWAFSYNLVAIPLAASGRLSMVLAAVAMAFSSIMVVLNALRLKTVKLSTFEDK